MISKLIGTDLKFTSVGCSMLLSRDNTPARDAPTAIILSTMVADCVGQIDGAQVAGEGYDEAPRYIRSAGAQERRSAAPATLPRDRNPCGGGIERLLFVGAPIVKPC
jgi:hypothetical protein